MGRRLLHRGGALLVAFALACVWQAGPAVATPRSRAATPASDRAATLAYYEAKYAFAQSVEANLAPSRAAAEAFADKVAGECPNGGAGAPQIHAGSQGQGVGIGRVFREGEQLGKLREEADLGLLFAWFQPDRQALAALARKIDALRWSSPALTRSLHLAVARYAQELASEPPNLCADARAWVASGFKTLGPATTALLKSYAGSRSASQQSHKGSLAKDESPRAKALIHKSKALANHISGSFTALAGLARRLSKELGLKSPLVSAEPSTKGKLVGEGQTAAGGKYQVRVEPSQPPAASEPNSCQLNVRIETSLGTGGGGCYLPGQAASSPSVNCAEGLLTIEAATLPEARTARLRLSNGREITSSVTVVPTQQGGSTGIAQGGSGSVGVYFQVVRGPSPIPVSLTELGAHGETLRTRRLTRVVECTKHPLKDLPGGLRTIVTANAPGGMVFSIVGEHYRFLGGTYFALSVSLKGGEGGGGESSSSQRPRVLTKALFTGCQPHPYAIVYGLLKEPRDTVLARVAGRLQRLRRARLPASLGTKGILVYLAAAVVPSELLVVAPDGTTVLAEKYGTFETERLQCSSEEEGEGSAIAV